MVEIPRLFCRSLTFSSRWGCDFSSLHPSNQYHFEIFFYHQVCLLFPAVFKAWLLSLQLFVVVSVGAIPCTCNCETKNNWAPCWVHVPRRVWCRQRLWDGTVVTLSLKEVDLNFSRLAWFARWFILTKMVLLLFLFRCVSSMCSQMLEHFMWLCAGDGGNSWSYTCSGTAHLLHVGIRHQFMKYSIYVLICIQSIIHIFTYVLFFNIYYLVGGCSPSQ